MCCVSRWKSNGETDLTWAWNYKANGITSTKQRLFLRRLNPDVMLFVRFVLSKLSRNHFTSASIPRDMNTVDISASHVCLTVDRCNQTLKTSHFWKKCFGCDSVILFLIAIYFIKTKFSLNIVEIRTNYTYSDWLYLGLELSLGPRRVTFFHFRTFE